MVAPQPGIFALGSRTHHHLEFDLTGSIDELRELVPRLGERHVTGGATNLVVGFGPELWRQLATTGVAEGLGPFTEITSGSGHRAPSTQHDLWAWVHGAGVDEVLDGVRAIGEILAPVARLASDVPCFVYHDSRDLTGFIDGTANPTPAEAAEVACVPDGRPGAGGSHVIVQRWVHALDRFGTLAVDEQQRVFGRTKLDSVALPPAERPADAHISRAEVLDDSGAERPIYRRSTPFGSASEQGLLFVAFSAERDRFDAMLRQMFGNDESGIEDRLLSFSTATSGAYYFAPSVPELRALGIG